MIYEIEDLPKPENCQNCKPCLRIRLMEMGLFKGEKIEVKTKKLGLWIINLLSDSGQVVSTLALRQDEFDKMCLKKT